MPAEPDDLINPRLLRTDQARMLLEQAGGGKPLPALNLASLQSLIDGLCELTQRDAQTGLANRAHFMAVLHREIDRVARSGQLALLLRVEIDAFRQVREATGQVGADALLGLVARRLADRVRPMDTVARTVEDGFAILLPDCELHFGRLVAERLRVSLTGLGFDWPAGVEPGLSLGGAFAPQWIRSSAVLWMERADQQLYRARSEGGNRVRLEEQLLGPVSSEERDLLFGAMDAQPADLRGRGPGLSMAEP